MENIALVCFRLIVSYNILPANLQIYDLCADEDTQFENSLCKDSV